jgi:hypothetical protein
VGSEDTNVYCLNASSGKKVWQTATGYWVWSSPAVADGNVYVGSEDYNIYCFDAFSGTKKWSYETGGFVDSSPAIANGVLFVGCSDYYVYAVALGDSVELLPSQSSGALPWGTIVFDAVAVVVAFAVVFELVHFVRSTKQEVKLETGGQRFSWLSKHADAVCILLTLVFCTIFLVDLGGGPLWVDDEKIYSQCAFHMFKSGDYLTPWAFGRLSMWLAKPPLFMWLMSISYQLFGVTNLSTRFWNPVFGTLSLILIYYLGKKLYNKPVGFLSAFTLGTFMLYNLFARRAMIDVPLVFFIMASIYFFILNEKTGNTKRYTALGGLFFGLAFMTKHVAALLVPLILFTYFVATGRGIRFLFTKRFKRFWLVAFLVVAPWIVYMVLRFGPDFWQSFLGYSVVSRAITPIEGHVGGYMFYFDFLFKKETWFWVILLPFAAGLLVYNSVVKRVKADTLLLVWVILVLLIFSCVQTKIIWYILPVYPAFALAIASFLYQVSKKAQPILRYLWLNINRITKNVLGNGKTPS